MPEKLGKYPKDGVYSGPLNVGKGKGEPGPDVANPPTATPADPLGYLPGGGKKGK